MFNSPFDSRPFVEERIVAEFTQETLKKVKTYALESRKSLVTKADFGSPGLPTVSLDVFLKSLPKIYMARDLMRVAKEIQRAKKENKVCHFSLGSHTIKNGLGPYILDLMKKGFITALSFNGSALVHDFELAYIGSTSEDVDEQIGEGKFGLAKETAENINRATQEGVSTGKGLGESLGAWIAAHTPHPEDSLLATAVKLKIPATVHIAIGTDIIHIHPSFSPSHAADGSYRDFLKFTASISELQDGIYLNIGSAVILPEVFLKAISLARNLGHTVDRFFAVNIDFIRHYRTRRNVLDRPTQKGGEAIELIGPHEILIPLLHGAILSA